jgi:hypothetical protein
MLSHLSDRELLELASCLNRGLPLIVKARSGEISTEERKELEVGVKRVLELLGIATPLGGRLATIIAARKPGPIMRKIGVADAVDAALELLMRLSQIAVRTEFDSRILEESLPESPLTFKGIDDDRAGFVCEALGRLWLREVKGGDWSTARYEIIGVRDVDALAEHKEGETLNLCVAEIKRTLRWDHVENIEDLVSDLKKHYFAEKRRIERTIRSLRIKSLWVIDFSEGPKHSIEEELKNRLTDKIEQEIRFIYLDELKNSCKEAERVGRTLLKSIELLESVGIIRK